MTDFQRYVDRLRRALAARLAMRAALGGVTIALFAWGAGVLTARLAGGLSRWHCLWGAVLLAPAVAVAWWAGRRRVPSPEAILAMIDRRSGGGGLLMASGEMPLGRWDGRVASPVSPAVAYRPGGRLAGPLLAVGFVAACFALPSGGVASLPHRGLHVSEELDRLADQAEALREAGALDERAARRIDEQLEEVRRAARGDDPARTWESMDSLARRLQRAADAAAENAASAAEKLTRAEALGEALEAGEAWTPESREEAMRQLARQAREAAGQDGALTPGQRQSLDEQARSAAEGKLDAEQLAKLRQTLREAREGLAEKARQLAESGLIDPETLREMQQAGRDARLDPETLRELADRLAECPDGQAMEAAIEEMLERLSDGDGQAGRGQDGQGWALGDGEEGDAGLPGQAAVPGRGGIGRGPGDAPLTHGQESDPSGTRFRPKVIPPGQAADLRRSMLLGRTRGKPGEYEGSETTDATTGALEGAESGEHAAHRTIVLPRHQQAVRRYFERSR